jgi:signal transduction histidine kinase
MGVPTEDKKILFQPFFKTKNKESSEMNKNSNGLGLNICKRIAKRLGGDLVLNEALIEGC